MKIQLSRYHLSRLRTIGAIVIIGLVVALGPFLYAFSHLDREMIYRQYHKEIQFTNKLVNIFYLPSFLFASKLERYDLYLKDDNWKFLDRNLPPGYADQLLTDKYKQEVKGQFVSAGQKIDVKVRYRGGTDNHWRDPKKSWQIKFPADKYFDRSRDIALIIPDDRKYLVEEITNFRARRWGLVVPETKFVNLFVNGKRQGVYWQVEDFRKDLLEKQNVPGDINFYGGVNMGSEPQGVTDYFTSLDAWSKFSTSAQTETSNFSDLSLLLDIINNPSDSYFKQHLPEMVDMDNLLKWQILQSLMTSTHEIGPNVRMYFDTSKGKFSFIPWDVSLNDLPPQLEEAKYNTLLTRVLKNPTWLHQRNQMLWDYINNTDNLKADLAEYDRLDNLTKNDLLKDWNKVDSNYVYRWNIANDRQAISDRYKYWEQNLKDANAFTKVYYKPGATQARVDFETRGFSSIKVQGITLDAQSCLDGLAVYSDDNNNQTLEATDKKIVDFRCANGVYTVDPQTLIYAAKDDSGPIYLKPGINRQVIFLVGESNKVLSLLTSLRSGDAKATSSKAQKPVERLKFSIVNAFSGKEMKNPEVKYLFDNLNLNFSSEYGTVQDFISSHPQFRENQGNIVLPSGSYFFDHTAIVPRGTKLIIEPGTVLNMASGVSLFSYSPVDAIGTALNRIRFQRSGDKPWGVLGILNVETATSTLDYVSIDSGKDDWVNGTFVSGSLSAYRSPLVLTNSIVTHAFGDDSINIKYQAGVVRDNAFMFNSADGIDLDVNDSLIEHNYFESNGNDGVDVSSGKPVVRYNTILKSGDKCISVGENSQIVIFGNLLNGCNIGIGIKDLSTPLIVNNTIVNNNFGLDAYEKKQIFGGSHGTVYNTIVWNNKTEIQTDKISDIKASYSNFQGGYQGENNVTIEPHFNTDFTLASDDQLLNKGLKDIVLKQFGLSLDTVPMGILPSITLPSAPLNR